MPRRPTAHRAVPVPSAAHGGSAYAQPYHGFSSGSTRRPSISLLKPLKRSTTAISSTIASSFSPSFRTAEVWTSSQYPQVFTADTETAMISLVIRSSLPVPSMTALTLRQFASR